MSKKKRESKPDSPLRLRLWPGIVILVIQLLLKFGTPLLLPEEVTIPVFGGVAGTIAVIIWWAFFSRAPGIERWTAPLLMIAGMVITAQFLHPTIAGGGMGMLFYILALPYVGIFFVIWAVATHRLSTRVRRTSGAAVILLSCGFWILLRTGGLDAQFRSEFAWRWIQSPEEQLLAQTRDTAALPAAAYTLDREPEWPGFRGPNRDGIVHGSSIGTDWTASPPRELWRRPVGPGWSSFTVHGELIYTQEQRGEEELVSCYRLADGLPVWQHADTARFWESNGGAGPRGTPTLSGGCVYSLGGTGILNALDAATGERLWVRDAAADTKTKLPIWGFSGSPLVLEHSVIAALSGSLISCAKETGEPQWIHSAEGEAYSSPHLTVIDGKEQILLQNKAGVISLDPEDGTLLWQHEWEGFPIVQPAIIGSNDLLVSVDEKSGVRRLKVSRTETGWQVGEVFTSTLLKPYFNDTVIHNGHAYGFDGPLLACMDLEDGSRTWRNGRYGRGQVLLLADQDLILVLSDRGYLALVKAVPDAFSELARYPSIEGKTWNHPVLVDDILLVRNDREMAAFRLAP
ncbi:PQQ-like beta-propeller repeat protein [bacterium]|nr:PQQ-like beta-propeller repeat protein [bacterium]